MYISGAVQGNHSPLYCSSFIRSSPTTPVCAFVPPAPHVAVAGGREMFYYVLPLARKLARSSHCSFSLPFRIGYRAVRLARQLTTKPPSPCERTAHDETLFRFTRGRFLTDEASELAKRHVRLDVDELARLAVQAAEAASNGPRTCIGIEKMADGMHNKAIRFTMDNGFQAVGKVPNPNAGLPHFTTASEVATMDFVCISSLLCGGSSRSVNIR